MEYEALHFTFRFKFPDGTDGCFDYGTGVEIPPAEARKQMKELAKKYRSFGFTNVKISEF